MTILDIRVPVQPIQLRLPTSCPRVDTPAAPAPMPSVAAEPAFRLQMPRLGERTVPVPARQAPEVMRPDMAPAGRTGTRRQARVKAAPPVDVRPPVEPAVLAQVLTDEQILAGYDHLLKLVAEADVAAHRARAAVEEYRVQMQARYFASQCADRGVPAR